MQEPYGIDECWLDVTGSSSLKGDGLLIAQEISRRRDILYARFRMPREMVGMPSGKRQNCYLYTAGIQWKFITALTN